jgi:hypothetical protein
VTAKDIDIKVAEQIIARKRKEEMGAYGKELQAWLDERGLDLEATIILKKGQVIPMVSLVRAAKEKANGASD